MKKIIISSLIMISAFVALIIFCVNSNQKSVETKKKNEVSIETKKRNYVLDNKKERKVDKSLNSIEPYSEWIYQGDSIKLVWVNTVLSNCIHVYKKDEIETWEVFSTDNKEKGSEISLMPHYNEKNQLEGKGIHGYASVENNEKIILRFDKKDKRIDNKKEIVFYRTKDNIPKLIVQAFLRENGSAFFYDNALDCISYEQISGDNSEGSIKVTGKFRNQKRDWEDIFVINKNNKCYDIFYEKEKIYSYVLNGEPLNTAVLAHLYENENMDVTYAEVMSSYDAEKKMQKVHVDNYYYKEKDIDEILGGDSDLNDDRMHYIDDFYVMVDSKKAIYQVYDKNNKLVYEYTPQILN